MSLRILIVLASICMGIQARSSEESEAVWIQMPGNAVQISAKGDYLWAVNRAQQPIYWHQGGWRYPHIIAVQVAASADGYAYALAPTQPDHGKSNIWRFNPTKGVYEYQNTMGMAQITAIAHNNAYGVGYTGCMAKWDGAAWAWVFNLGDCPDNVALRAVVQVSMGESGELWKLDANSTVFRLTAGAWQKQEIPGYARYIDVQSPSRVVMVDMDDNAWYWDAKVWRKLKGNECMSATINYKSVFCVDRKERIWRLDI